jgi:uncharacterized membrane protein (UPF0182 family)
VLNFYELRDNVHIKTIAVMDELEGVIILSNEDSKNILVNNREINKESASASASALVNHHVLITAGSKGVLRFYKFEIKV